MAEYRLHSTAFTARFQCLGDACEDTCCKSWSMQVDGATVKKYRNEAPELVPFVVEGPTGGFIMKRDAATDFCLKFQNGLCGIHKKYGSAMLGDACNFYPRVTRSLGAETVMTAAMSCPEAVRLALYEDDGFAFVENSADRLPNTLKNYLPEDMAAQDALAVHQAFLHAALDESATPERNMMRIVSVSQSLAAIGKESWPIAVPFYLKSADARLAVPERAVSDPFNLLHALMGIAAAAGMQNRVRLLDTMRDMETALKVTLDWQTLGIMPTEGSEAAYETMDAAWRAAYAPAFDTALRRWIAMQLSIALFPFSGFGADMKERAYVMGVRFATVRLALMCACQVQGKTVEEAQQVRIIQSIARVLDHLAEPELSLKIYAEPGWLRESRLRALVGDR